jgi:hypothetical protein
MESQEKLVLRFLLKIQSDKMATPTLVSIFAAILMCWKEQEFKKDFFVSRSLIMRLSKIKAFGTYHKGIKQLINSGYIDYSPSYHPLEGTRISLCRKKSID